MCYNHTECNTKQPQTIYYKSANMRQENQMRLLLLSAALRLASISAAFAVR